MEKHCLSKKKLSFYFFFLCGLVHWRPHCPAQLSAISYDLQSSELLFLVPVCFTGHFIMWLTSQIQSNSHCILPRMPLYEAVHSFVGIACNMPDSLQKKKKKAKFGGCLASCPI